MIDIHSRIWRQLCCVSWTCRPGMLFLFNPTNANTNTIPKHYEYNYPISMMYVLASGFSGPRTIYQLEIALSLLDMLTCLACVIMCCRVRWWLGFGFRIVKSVNFYALIYLLVFISGPESKLCPSLHLFVSPIRIWYP